MATHPHDSSWPDAHMGIPVAELAQLCDLSTADIDALVLRGALPPVASGGETGPHFSVSWVGPLRDVARLRAQHDLDLPTVCLLLGYLQRIAQLEHQVRSLQAHLPHPQHLPREGPTPWREPHA